MYAIPLYPPDAEDFSTNGLGLMLPTECTIEEIKNGMFELKMVQPITDDYRWAQVEIDCILKAAAPVRESPLYELAASTVDATTQTTVTRKVYTVKTNGGRLHLRQKPSTSSKILSKYKVGTKVILLEDNGKGWYRVSIASGGATGWMYAQYLKYSHDTTETITSTNVVTQEEMRVMPSRDQLFRVYSIENDTESGLQTVRALHIFYDLRRNVIDDDYKPSKAAVATVAKEVFSKALVPHDFDVHVGNISGTVTGEYGYKGITEVFLAPETGIAAQCNGYIVRDNFDLFLLPNEVRDTGVTIRRGKNLIGVVVTTDESSVVNRIVPCGQNKDGDPLYLSGVRYIDSPRNTEKTIIKAARIDYDVKVSDDDDAEFKTDAAAREELKRLVNADYDAGIDLPSYGMEVDFAILANTAEYADYAEYLHLQSVHLFDTITVIDELIGIKAKVCVTGYVWNVLTEQYDDMTLGDVQQVSYVYGYNIPNGTVSGNKLVPGSVDGTVMLRDASIGYAKIQQAAIEQLAANAITAMRAHINELVSDEITTDQLYADLATIAVLQLTTANIDNANIDWAAINTLQAQIAEIVTAKIGSANIDWAHIVDLVTDTAIFTQGVGGELYIARLAVTEANMVSLTVGELVVRGEDGCFYSVSVDADGNIVTTLKQIGNDDVADSSIDGGAKIIEGSITAGALNAQDIFADNAIIRQLIAANLDVDTLFAREATVHRLNAYDITGNEYLRLFVPAQAGSVVSGSTVLINGEQFRVITPKAVFAILSEDSPDGEELLSIDENGVSGRTAAFDELRSRTVLQATAQAKYAPASGGELSAILAEIGGTYLKGDVSIDASNVSGGRLTLRGLMGGGRLLITGGTFTGVSLNDCTALVRFEGSVFTSAGTAITLDNARLVLARCAFSAKQGLALMRDADAVLGSCTGACTTLATLNGGSELRITGDNLPYGVIPDGVDGEVYSPYPFIPAPEEPEAEAETEIALTATASRTWDNGWLSTSTYGSAVYQGAVNGGALRRGCIWFDRSAISGKEILSATLSVRRMTGFGGGGAVEVGVYGTTATGPSGTPMLGSKYASASIAREETKVIDVTQAAQHLADGDIAGLILYSSQTGTFSGKSYTYGYSKFYGSGDANAPVLTVRYKG